MRINEIASYYDQQNNNRKKEEKRNKRIALIDHLPIHPHSFSDSIHISDAGLRLEQMDSDRHLVEKYLTDIPDSPLHKEKIHNDFKDGNYNSNMALLKLIEESQTIMI